jgi:hypothetical protein
MGRDSSVSIATRHRLDGPGIEFKWERDFPHPSTPDLGPELASYIMGTASFLWVKRLGRDDDHPPDLHSAEVKEIVELYLYSFRHPWPVMG